LPTSVDHPKRTSVLAIIAVIGLFASCGGSSSTSPTPSVSFSSTDLIVGTGAIAAVGNAVTVNYTGWLYDSSKPDNKGTQFDTSIGRAPFAFQLGAGQVIKGWDQGVVGMRVGGMRRLVIPPDLAYGSAGAGGGAIPPNAALVFDINLLAVQ
jgi:FKBP-type peptidyl-prolyl cis-trans isomerase FkpA